ncbi:MAG: CHAD domain-containing protein [Hyphomicrobiaceae bacterium]
MAYKFRLKEPLKPGIHRIAGEQFDSILKAPPIDADADARARWIHETRKSLKRLRALLRLVHSGLDTPLRRAENAELRRIGHLLSPMRDRHVLHTTIQNVSTVAKDPDLARACAWFRRNLKTHPDAESPAKTDQTNLSDEARISSAATGLEDARERFRKLPVTGVFIDVISEGLVKSHKVGQRALSIATKTESDEALHDLRKALQTFWRHSKLVQLAWPEIAAIRIETARQVSQILGDAQDLAVLAAAARSFAKLPRDEDHLKLLTSVCRQRQKHLCAMAFPLANRLLAMPSSAIGEEFAQCWLAAEHEAREQRREAEREARQKVPPKRRTTPAEKPTKKKTSA